MIDRPGTEQQPRPITGSIGREKLEENLRKALQAGASQLPQQVRYVLAISQMTAARSVTAPHPETPLKVPAARLSALVQAADLLDADECEKLLRDIQHLDDDDIRLSLTFKLLAGMPVESYKNKLRTFWEQTNRLANPLSRSVSLFLLTPLITPLDESSGLDSGPAIQLTETVRLAQGILNTEARIRSLVALSLHLPRSLRNQLLKHVLDGVKATTIDNLRANAINAMADDLPEELIEHAFGTAREIQAPIERVRALTSLARRVTSELRFSVESEALKAIADIENEEERTQALVTFAPHLETAIEDEAFPKLLEQALGIAVTLSRRHLRARALVGLAPHLTSDLQGEALAAVHSLSNERERALLLAELAPTLPQDMLVASLAVAHTMREQDSRVHALTILAHYAPQQARSQTMLDALAAASNLPHHFERVMALVGLVDILPPHLLDQAFTNALETTRLIDNANARARAFSLLGSHLPPSLLDRALEAAYQIEDVQQRLNALSGMIAQVPEEQKAEALTHMLDCAEQMPFDYKRARALVSIAPHLTEEIMPAALTMVDNLEDPFDQASAYIALIQNMPRENRPEIVSKAWRLVNQIEDGYDQSSALAAIAPFLPEDQHNDLAELAATVIKSIEDEYDRASAITILAPALAQGKPASRDVDSSFEKYDVIREGIRAALDIPQQSLRAQQLRAGVDLWSSLEAEPKYVLWTEVSERLIKLPLADTLLCLGAIMVIFEQLLDREQLKEIALILGLR